MKKFRVKWINGYENLYKITNDGRVFRCFNCGHGKHYLILDTEIKQRLREHYPYKYVELTKNGKVKKFNVHRLVITHFKPTPKNKNLQCAHMDGNPKNNHISNLRYKTPLSNTRMKLNHGTLMHSDKHYAAKRTNEQIKNARERFKNKEITIKGLAEELKMHEACVYKMIKKQTWKHV